jgi:hypothetical protein
MNDQEKALARLLFQNKINSLEGTAFENFFSQIMNYEDSEFEQIKPWGNIGDRKNDGFIRDKGIYFQVYAPEDIRQNYPDSVKKLETDFEGLKKHWKPINEFYFVINDKYHGVNADANNSMASIVKNYNLKKGKILTARDLENKLFNLDDNKIKAVIGFLPDTEQIFQINYSVLDQVIGYIMKLPIKPIVGKIKFPDWNEKIEFNNLGEHTKNLLNNASYNLHSLEEFLANENFLAEELQKKLTGLYFSLKNDFSGDNLFWEIIEKCLPKQEQTYFPSVMTILAKYFESCDIFEEPKND